MAIKLIALDLDGTTLNKEGKLSEGNRSALQAAADKGVNIVIATGRPFCALPQEILDFEPVRYVLTSCDYIGFSPIFICLSGDDAV